MEVTMVESARSDSRAKAASQFNARLPLLTHGQINALAQEQGLTKTQVIIIAVDRLSRDLQAGSAEASKDIRRLKTVARIAPQFDLGQDG
jgi:hypothetical protein